MIAVKTEAENGTASSAFSDADDRKRSRELEKIQRFEIYRTASGAITKDDSLQVPLLLHVMGEDCLEIYNSFSWQNEGDQSNIGKVLEEFENYFLPQKNVVLERFHFNKAVPNEGVIGRKTSLKT